MDQQNQLLAEKWFKFAEIDLELVKKLTEDYFEDKWYNIVCYHCQQSAEKFLKGFRVLNGLENKTIHHLDTLYKDCRPYISYISKEEEVVVRNACAELESYAVHVRYPDYEELEYEDMKSAIKKTHIIKDFIMLNSRGLQNSFYG